MSSVRKLAFLAGFLLLAAFGMAACSDHGVIEEEKFALIYTDLLVAQDSLGADTLSTSRILAGLYEKYDITAESYRYTVESYNAKPERWNLFFEKVYAELERRRNELLKMDK